MANNGAVGGQLQGAASHNNLGLGAMAAGALGTSHKGPILDRYHSSGGDEHHGWMKSKGKKNNGIALSALTLLAFLFFLNILQNCLQDHMDQMKDKGKGYFVQPGFNITIPVPVPVINQGRSEAQRANKQRGDTGDDVNSESDNSLEIDNLTEDEAEERIVPETKSVKRRMYTKRKENNYKNKNMQKVNTLYNIND